MPTHRVLYHFDKHRNKTRSDSSMEDQVNLCWLQKVLQDKVTKNVAAHVVQEKKDGTSKTKDSMQV